MAEQSEEQEIDGHVVTDRERAAMRAILDECDRRRAMMRAGQSTPGAEEPPQAQPTG